ncbi:50S ribosomal protein L32e [uncultured archaeon]|nr:50S ribosomal protein L32e [uncultured archaeon]
MAKLKFLRRNWSKASRLGKGRKKKQVWRSPKGRHSKTRNERKGYPAIVKIGYRTEEKTRDMIKGKKPVIVMNTRELEKIRKNEIAVIGNIGMKKKLEIAKKAEEKGIQISNVNAKKILKKFEKRQKMKAEEKKTKKEIKKEEKEAKEEKKAEEKKE